MIQKPKIKLNIIKESIGYTAVGKWKNISLVTHGKNWVELQKMILDMINLSFEEHDFKFTIEEISFSYDLASFFDFNKVINAKALSDRLGMNQSLLAQYIKGHKKPSPKQTKRILDTIHLIGKELSESNLVV